MNNTQKKWIVAVEKDTLQNNELRTSHWTWAIHRKINRMIKNKQYRERR